MWNLILHENHRKKVIKMKTQDKVPDFMKQTGRLKGLVDGIVNG